MVQGQGVKEGLTKLIDVEVRGNQYLENQK